MHPIDCLIVGGGIHGCHVAKAILSASPNQQISIRIADPNKTLAASWTQFTARVGMRFLRSPAVHHIDLEPGALRNFSHSFASQRGVPQEAEFLGPYSRPSLGLFQAHLERAIDAHQLRSCHSRCRVVRLSRSGNHWCAETTAGEVRARNVVLCLGQAQQPNLPDWASRAKQRGLPVNHVFDEHYEDPAPCEDVAVIGGGISAAQLALRLAQIAPGRVTLISRRELRVHEFDTNPGWMGPKYLAGFHEEKDYAKRRMMILHARQRGTVPAEVFHAVQRALRKGDLLCEVDEIGHARPLLIDGRIRIALAGSLSRLLVVDRVILCTGFSTNRPGGTMVDRLVADYRLPVASCGYPVAPPSLQWMDGLFLSGALAELEIGPVARNIIGARLAASRIQQQASSFTANSVRAA